MKTATQARKSERQYVLAALAAVVFADLLIWGCHSRSGNFFSSININVPNSAIVSNQTYPSDTGDEDLMLLKLSPSQLRALLAQFKTRRDFKMGIGSNWIKEKSSRPDMKAFLAKVPSGAVCGGFRFDHVETSPHWPTLCSFAIDKLTGRVWFYAWSIYN